MKAVKTLLVNTLLLSATSLAMRGVGVFFQLYIAEELGAEGVGLLQLISSIYAFAATVATSGIKLTATRLISEELGAGGRGARAAAARCVAVAAATGLFAALLLWIFAPPISARWLDDIRATASLRVLAATLPLAAVSGALSGYFTAVQRLGKSSAVQLSEQAVRIIVTAALLGAHPNAEVGYACMSVAIGSLSGEMYTLTLLALLYSRDSAALPSDGAPVGLMRRLAGISAPVAAGLYARMALSTLENILTPKELRASGIAASAALAAYGIIEGMVFPVLMFPCAFIGVVVELLVPELTESQVTGRSRRINYIIGRVFRFGLPFTVWAFGIMLIFAEELGAAIFSEPSAAGYLRILSPMVLMIYIDAMSDGILKGLGRYAATLRFSILDSLLGVAMVVFLLPRYGVAGYIFTTVFTKAVNCVLSTGCLCRYSGWRLPASGLCKAVGCILLATNSARALLGLAGLGGLSRTAEATALILCATVLYLLLLRLTLTISRGDIRWLISAARG